MASMTPKQQPISMHPLLLAGGRPTVPAPVMTDYSLYPRLSRLGGHIHGVYHIVFVIEGNGILEHDCGRVVMSPGDILIIDPGCTHIFETAQQSVRVFAFNFYLLPLGSFEDGEPRMDKLCGNTAWMEQHALRTPLAELFGLRATATHLRYARETGVWGRCMELVTELHETVSEYVVSDNPVVRRDGYRGYAYQSLVFLLRLLAVLSPRYSISTGNPHQHADPLVQAVDRYLRQHLSERYHLDALASQLGYAPAYVCTRFSRSLGMSIGAYHHRLRIREACKRLREGRHSITRIALDLGYSSSQHFSAVFRRIRNMTPRQYRRQAEVF
ncbi:MAG: helix-turn-helix domain-containing protein [Chitinivibrionales bacterium]|nr:helix-turn-helix domain-containing protein [Chitinivibrionales bacterium]